MSGTRAVRTMSVQELMEAPDRPSRSDDEALAITLNGEAVAYIGSGEPAFMGFFETTGDEEYTDNGWTDDPIRVSAIRKAADSDYWRS